MKRTILLLILGLGVIASCTKKPVPEPPVQEPLAIILNQTNLYLLEGTQFQLEATILPEDAVTEEKNIWESQKSEIASVDEKGMVTAVVAGKTIIRVTLGELHAECAIEVYAPEVPPVFPEGVKLDQTELSIEKGESAILKATISPDNADFKTLTWTSSDDKVAVVSNGKVTAISYGKCEITVSTENNKTAKCAVTVTDPDLCVDPNGRVYKTVVIGGREWMAENYAYMPRASKLDQLYVEPAFYVYDYEGTNVEEAMKSENYKKYGVLYNYRAAAASAPKGWRLPTEQEWQTLEFVLGMDPAVLNTDFWRGDNEVAHKFMATTDWTTPGNNESGMNVLPAGRMTNAKFSYIGKAALFWSKSLHSETEDNAFLYGRMFQDNRTGINRAKINEGYAVSVRYIKE